MLILGNQIKTLNLQTSYDAKLANATADALKAFQLNTINSDTSDISNSKLRDIEASVNSFFYAIANNFNMAGYNQEILADYVPALVYTMYDGYYIYSPYINTLDSTNSNEIMNSSTGMMEDKGSDADILDPNTNSEATYKQGDRLVGLKPYIHYSCRYTTTNSDFVITYSLDNYITIQGKINGKPVYDYGYLLDDVVINGNTVQYRGVQIKADDTLRENVYDPKRNTINNLECIKLNGVKYYKDIDNTWFSIMNGEKHKQDQFNPQTSVAIEYYKEAYDFTQKIRKITYIDSNGVTKTDGYGLENLSSTNAVDENGNSLNSFKRTPYRIFDNNRNIEDPDSNFNQQRLDVIRYSIEKNLSIAIANYNNYSGVLADFRMPELKEDEWDKIVNNVSIISFLQGLNIGGKIYNGYSIITNNKNQEAVDEESIYIIADDGQYHRANDSDLIGKSNFQGVLNIDFERKSNVDASGQPIYFFPKNELGCYSSIVNQSSVIETNNFYQYMEDMKNKNYNLASAYFTALGRERYGLYKSNNNNEQLKAKFGA